MKFTILVVLFFSSLPCSVDFYLSHVLEKHKGELFHSNIMIGPWEQRRKEESVYAGKSSTEWEALPFGWSCCMDKSQDPGLFETAFLLDWAALC